MINSQSVHRTLRELDSLDKLSELFCTHLNYGYSGDVVSHRGWKQQVTDTIRKLKLTSTHDDFHVVFCEIDRLLLGTQRPIINQILKTHPYCLIVFSDSSYQSWHFVNVKYDEEAKNRRLFRRIVIGPDERLHTAAQRMSLLEVADESMTALDLQREHDKAFDVEKVTKEFFNTFMDMFQLLRKEIEKRNRSYSAKADEQAQILLDRMLFLYFIQKKGWLDGKKDYLYQKFLEVEKRNSNGFTYYKKVLLPLFQALSTSGPTFRKQLGDIPFLNGGLFEVSPYHSRLPFELKISNSIFKRIFKELLENFNFTVREDTPLDIEVAIDPEMLGKVFENLILQREKDRDLRKVTGSYYTPRVVVHFMCQQSLKEYLCTESEIERKKIETLFEVNPADQLEEADIKELENTLSTGEARLLHDIILRAYVLDPAVGSGAFLVGMLHEMIRLLKLLDVRQQGMKAIERKNYDYELKRQLIENCLYGVDIQEQAVRICELRLWLSLVVDYEREGAEDVPPLPNLSYKVRCGDSLIEKLFGHSVQLDQLVRTDKGRQLIDEIREEKEAYFLSRDIEEKNKKELGILAKQCELAEMLIRERRKWAEEKGVQSHLFGETAEERRQKEEKQKELRELDRILYQAGTTKEKVQAMLQGKIPMGTDDIHRLRQNLGLSFIWKLDFAEVFKERRGFDIVIANPPYISFGLRGVGKAKKEWAHYVRSNYPDSAEYKLSIYAIFMNKGVILLKDRGVLSYITPDSFLLGRYFSKLRNYLVNFSHIKEVVLFEKDFWEAGVIGRPVITFIRKHSDALPANAVTTASLCSSLKHLKSRQSYSCEQSYFRAIPFNRLRLFFDQVSYDLVNKLEDGSIPLGKIVSFASGLIGKKGKEDIISSKREGKNWCPGLISGKEVRKYYTRHDGNFILFDKRRLKSGFKDAKYFEPKIFLRQTGDSLIAALDDTNLLCLNNLHVGNLVDRKYSLKYILALLNSHLLNIYYRLISLEFGRVMAQTDIETIELLPIKEPSQDQQQTIEGLVDSIHQEMEGGDTPAIGAIAEYSDRLKKIINETYGLTKEEIAFVDKMKEGSHAHQENS